MKSLLLLSVLLTACGNELTDEQAQKVVETQAQKQAPKEQTKQEEKIAPVATEVATVATPKPCDAVETEDGAEIVCGSKTVKINHGKAGKDGVNGTDGINGKDGSDGLAGSNGLDGVAGVAGAQGERGERGEKGDKGDTGDQGNQGIAGANGVDGADALEVNVTKGAVSLGKMNWIDIFFNIYMTLNDGTLIVFDETTGQLPTAYYAYTSSNCTGASKLLYSGTVGRISQMHRDTVTNQFLKLSSQVETFAYNSRKIAGNACATITSSSTYARSYTVYSSAELEGIYPFSGVQIGGN